MGLFDKVKKKLDVEENLYNEENEKINCINVLDDGIEFNGHLLTFPLSYDEIKSVLGEAKIDSRRGDGNHITYTYDDMGIQFEGATAYLSELKKKKAYKDDSHTIVALTLYVTGTNVFESFNEVMPKKHYIGNLTFLGQKMDQDKVFKVFGGYNYSHLYQNDQGEKTGIHISTQVYVKNFDMFQSSVKFDGQLYDNDRFLQDVNLTFKPERPKSQENYNIAMPDEACLTFDTFNFKLAVINELMYNQEVLKPYFDIYDYMEFKKASWDLETFENIKPVVSFFKKLPIPSRFADLVTEINMDGSDEIYMQIAPEWDGSDERFDFYKLTESELKQFKNLKKMQILGSSNDAAKLRKICEPLGIEVAPLVE